jgi:hypothetical protein
MMTYGYIKKNKLGVRIENRGDYFGGIRSIRHYLNVMNNSKHDLKPSTIIVRDAYQNAVDLWDNRKKKDYTNVK